MKIQEWKKCFWDLVREIKIWWDFTTKICKERNNTTRTSWKKKVPTVKYLDEFMKKWNMILTD